ncbi:ribonuclease P protein component [Reichenbachiella carrageenanivorans]|uniref:Ribonuclease P protein component n=1 Tax=Reichenbachiella carrageenanivorans TaxID=2979869 RepID=A0ABY6D1H0_9BACT|nr:ribonuclease P protein component [Reichenbachiella carrageenanivorans]UXX79764.1 ribonuclease P protein component [Reichenbachiella carrageenanivorans]
MEGKNQTYRNCSFPKSERLSSKKIIDALFAKGASFYFYPFSVRFLLADEQASCHQLMISVSKRNFKRAVDRNRIKRLMRESYRLHKYLLSDVLPEGKFLVIAYIYTAKEIHPYSFVASKLVDSISRLKAKLDK